MVLVHALNFNLIFFDCFGVLLLNIMQLSLINHNLLFQGPKTLFFHVQACHVSVDLVIEILDLSLVVDDLIIQKYISGLVLLNTLGYLSFLAFFKLLDFLLQLFGLDALIFDD